MIGDALKQSIDAAGGGVMRAIDHLATDGNEQCVLEAKRWAQDSLNMLTANINAALTEAWLAHWRSAVAQGEVTVGFQTWLKEQRKNSQQSIG